MFLIPVGEERKEHNEKVDDVEVEVDCGQDVVVGAVHLPTLGSQIQLPGLVFPKMGGLVLWRCGFLARAQPT